jgi:hypothetical protein
MVPVRQCAGARGAAPSRVESAIGARRRRHWRTPTAPVAHPDGASGARDYFQDPHAAGRGAGQPAGIQVSDSPASGRGRPLHGRPGTRASSTFITRPTGRPVAGSIAMLQRALFSGNRTSRPCRFQAGCRPPRYLGSFARTSSNQLSGGADSHRHGAVRFTRLALIYTGSARGAHPVRGKGRAHPRQSNRRTRTFFQPDQCGLQAR